MNIAERQRLIAAQACPRTVALSRRGRSWVLMLAAVLVTVELGLLAYLGLHVSSMRADLLGSPASLIALLLPFTPIIFLSGLRKQKYLLQNGEVAIATVTFTTRVSRASRVNQNDDVRTVRYEFHDRSGALLEGTSVDGTLMLQEASSMLVFYDSEDSANQLAQCASFYKIVAPGLDNDVLDDA